MTLANLPPLEQVAAILTASRDAIKDAYSQALNTGRPRGPDRCPCGAMTAKRAAARRHKCSPTQGKP